jgi:hypothetical protein
VEPGFLDVKLSRRGSWAAALVLLAVALGLRLSGIGWGLPNDLRNQSLHPDEHLIYLFATQTPYLQPGFYNYGTLYFTLMHLANDAGMQYGWVPMGETTPESSHVRGGVLGGRYISAVSGAATVSLVFATLLLITGTLGSFIGAVAMLLAPGHVVHSRFATTDVFATMLIALAAYLMIRALQSEKKPTWKSLLTIGLVIGLAAGTKYIGILLLLPATYALITLKGRLMERCYVERRPAGSEASASLEGTDKERRHLAGRAPAQFAILIAATVLGFLVATPGALLQTEAFLRGVTYEMSHSAEGHGLVFVNTPPGAVYHFLNLTEAVGLVPLFLGIAGLVWACIAKNSWAIACALFFTAYFAIIAAADVKFLRYVFPLLPLVALGIGYLAGRCHEERGWKRIVTGLSILMIGFTAATTAGAFSLTRLMLSEDPRDQAARWLEKETPRETTIGLVSDPWFYSPPLFREIGLLFSEDRLKAMAKNPRLVRYISLDGERKDWDVRLLEQNPDYVVFSSFEFLDHDRLSEPNFVQFIEQLSKNYDFIGLFWGEEPAFATDPKSMEFDRQLLRVIMRERFPKTHDMMYIRPTICVFRKKAP